MPLKLLDRLRAPAPDPARVAWLKGRAFAHRGLYGASAVENSASAFSAAIAAGLGIECDVRTSREGRAVVFHDETLDRLTEERGPVGGRSIGRLTATMLTGSSDRIPTLHDLLTLVGGRVPLLIELKTRRDRPVGLLCRAVRGDLEGYRGPSAVMSFDPRVGAWFARHSPAIVRGLVVTENGRRTLGGALSRHVALWQAQPDFLAYDIRDLPSTFASAQRSRGLPVLSWTVSSAELRERARIHADAPISEGEGVA